MASGQPCGASTASEWRRLLFPSVALAWRSFESASKLGPRITPAAPILFFGDLDKFFASPVRVLTVALNPSLREFPDDDPFRRFPLAHGPQAREPGRYLDSMSAYFRTDPYRDWFGAFEPLLNGGSIELLRERHILDRASHRHLLAGRHQPYMEQTPEG